MLLLVGVKVDGTLGGLVQFHDRAGGQLQYFAHGHLAGAQLDGQFDPHVQEQFQIEGRGGFCVHKIKV